MPEYDMEVTPERAEMIKRALIRQYEDQFGVEIYGYKEIRDGKEVVTYLKDPRGTPA